MLQLVFNSVLFVIRLALRLFTPPLGVLSYTLKPIGFNDFHVYKGIPYEVLLPISMIMFFTQFLYTHIYLMFSHDFIFISLICAL